MWETTGEPKCKHTWEAGLGNNKSVLYYYNTEYEKTSKPENQKGVTRTKQSSN